MMPMHDDNDEVDGEDEDSDDVEAEDESLGIAATCTVSFVAELSTFSAERLERTFVVFNMDFESSSEPISDGTTFVDFVSPDLETAEVRQIQVSKRKVTIIVGAILMTDPSGGNSQRRLVTRY